jgi:alpha-tubulin suppressor-like RCC1 family protein
MGNNTSGQRAIGYPTQPEAPGTKSIHMVDPASILHLAPGSDHFCFSEGSVFCAGANDQGQLGNGSRYQLAVYSPQLVLDGGVTDVVLGSEHTCALKDGNLYCWGSNQAHQLPLADPATPYRVSVASPLVGGVSHVAAAFDTTCMAKNREVRCWGQNTNGQLGLDSNTTELTFDSAMTAVNPIFDGDLSQLILSQTNTCAVLTDGALWCWGGNDYEQIGSLAEVGGPGWVTSPFHVSTNSTPVAKVIAGNNLCWVGTDGSLGCKGNLPVVTEMNNLSAQISPVVEVTSGADATCALTRSGEIYCGGNNTNRILDPSGVAGPLPFGKVHNGFSVTSFSISKFHGCGVEAGKLKCWGNNKTGVLGIGEADLGIHRFPIEVLF